MDAIFFQFPTKWQITFHRSLQHADCGLWRNTKRFGWVRALRFFSRVAWSEMYSSSNSTCGSMTCLLFRKEKLISLSLGLYIYMYTYTSVFSTHLPFGIWNGCIHANRGQMSGIQVRGSYGSSCWLPRKQQVRLRSPVSTARPYSSTYFNIYNYFISFVSLDQIPSYSIVQPVFPPSLITSHCHLRSPFHQLTSEHHRPSSYGELEAEDLPIPLRWRRCTLWLCQNSYWKWPLK